MFRYNQGRFVPFHFCSSISCTDLITYSLLNRSILLLGGCELDRTYAGPKLETTDDGKYKITLDFVRSMIQWFKDGKALPKRYVWEIVLGAHAHFVSEQSLVDIPLEDGVTCDVIGDVHGTFYLLCPCSIVSSILLPMLTCFRVVCRSILRRAPSFQVDRRANRKALFADERRSRRPRLMVN